MRSQTYLAGVVCCSRAQSLSLRDRPELIRRLLHSGYLEKMRKEKRRHRPAEVLHTSPHSGTSGGPVSSSGLSVGLRSSGRRESERETLSASVEAQFLLALDLNDTRILNHDFNRAKCNRTHRADDFTNSARLVIIESLAATFTVHYARFHSIYLLASATITISQQINAATLHAR